MFKYHLLKFGVLVLNYKCPKQCVFCFFYGFICDFLEFPLVKSSKIFTAHRTQRDTNFKHEKSRVCKGSFFYFFNFVFNHFQKNWSYRFPWKTSKTVCQILWNFTEGNSRKFTVSFAFCAHVDVIKYRKTLTFPLEHAQITWTFIPSMHAII